MYTITYEATEGPYKGTHFTWREREKDKHEQQLNYLKRMGMPIIKVDEEQDDQGKHD